jgi:hypothetical protein
MFSFLWWFIGLQFYGQGKEEEIKCLELPQKREGGNSERNVEVKLT